MVKSHGSQQAVERPDEDAAELIEVATVSETRFLSMIGLDIINNERAARLYAAMRGEAFQAARRLGSLRASEDRFREEITRMYENAGPGSKRLYDAFEAAGQTDRSQNWVIRWLIWSSFE